MEKFKETAIKVKVFQKGQVVIPVSLRKKYNIESGDCIDVLSSEKGILLRPSPKNEKSRTTTDSLYGIYKNYAAKKKALSERDIRKATRHGFTQGWGNDSTT